MTTKDLDFAFKRINEIENRITEMEGWRDPQGMRGQLDSIRTRLDDLEQFREIIQKELRKILIHLKEMQDERYCEKFTDEEMKILYDRSGLDMKEIGIWIQQMFFPAEKSVSQATVWRYVNGDIKDPITRDKVGKYLRTACAKASTKHTASI